MKDQPEQLLRILLLEDIPSDAELIESELRDADMAFVSQRVDTRETFIRALEEFHPDIVLSDYNLPAFDGGSALKIVREHYPAVPVVMVTGAVGDEKATELLKLGARDYVLKGQLARLAPAVQRALFEEQGIRARKAAEKALRESEARYQAAMQTANDAILCMKPDGTIHLWNHKAEEMFGYSAAEAVGLDLHQLIAPMRFREKAAKGLRQFIKTGTGTVVGKTLELVAWRRDKTEFPIELSISPMNINGEWHATGIIRDITERKQAVEALNASRDLLSSIIENAPIRVFWKDAELRYLGCNTIFARDAGVSRPEDLLGKDDYHMSWREQAGIYRADDKWVIDSDTSKLGFEELQTTPEGRTIWLRTSKVPLHDSAGKVFGVLGIYDDITERKQTAEALQHERDFATGIIETAQAIILVLDTGGRIVRFNPYMEKLSGYTLAEVQGQDWVDTFLPQRDHEQIRALFHGIVNDTRISEHVNSILTRDGKERKIEWHNKAFKTSTGNIAGVLATGHDITERERADQALRHANRAFKTLSACNHLLVHATDEQQLLQTMCRVIVEDGGYSAAWVGYKQNGAAQTIHLMAKCGFAPGDMDTMQSTWADSGRGCGPTVKSLSSGMTQVVPDVASDPDCAPCREQALKRGQASAIALPLYDNDEIFGSLTIYAAQTNTFGPKEIALLEEMAGDLAFGIRMLRLRQEQQRNAEQVRMGLEGTIQAIAGIVEMRDPYTAGHQQRVAQLAAAIAVEMGLPEERVRGIHLAGTIHDLGKIQTPAEILSKPGKLSAAEFSLIKDHPQNGYEILKNIEFPWPIAQIVWQHHEKLDGSGYPQGLKGSEILLEARILTVADVVEAMSSHRPYRAGLGIDVALEEIIRGRGTHYDPDAADKCIWLIREKGFKFL